jgi:hypothetical protein
VSTEPQDVRVRVDGARGESRRLVPGDSWRIDVP